MPGLWVPFSFIAVAKVTIIIEIAKGKRQLFGILVFYCYICSEFSTNNDMKKLFLIFALMVGVTISMWAQTPVVKTTNGEVSGIDKEGSMACPTGSPTPRRTAN